MITNEESMLSSHSSYLDGHSIVARDALVPQAMTGKEDPHEREAVHADATTAVFS